MTNKDENGLLPCPFCGGEAKSSYHSGDVRCENGHNFYYNRRNWIDTDKAWNTRAQPQNVEGDVDNEWFFRWIARGKGGSVGMSMDSCIDVIWNHPANPYSEFNPWENKLTDATKQEPPPIDVEALKREVFSASKYALVNREILDESNLTVAGIIIETIDHLASAGYLRAPLPRIEWLKTGLKNAVQAHYDIHSTCPSCNTDFVFNNGEWLLWCGTKEGAEAVLEAARAYLKASEGDK